MNTIFIDSENSKTSDLQRLLLNLTDKIDLRRKDKYITLSNLRIYYTWKNINKSYKNNTFKISAPTLNEDFELPDGSYNVSDIQDYFEYKKSMEKNTPIRIFSQFNTSITVYPNKIENRIMFKIKTGYYLGLLTPETMKLLGSIKSKITKDKNGENVPYLEITEVVLIHYNVVNNSYQQNSRVLNTFVPNKSFGELFDISPENLIFLKTFDSEFFYIEVSFTDQNSNSLEIEDKINITLVTN